MRVSEWTLGNLVDGIDGIDGIDGVVRCIGDNLRIVLIAVQVRRFDESNGPGQGNSDQQAGRVLDAVVGVELDFGQQVAESDAEEDARRVRRGRVSWRRRR